MFDAVSTPSTDARSCPTLEDCSAHLLADNPFLGNRVNGPIAVDADATFLHQTAFDRLVALAEEAQRGGRGLGAVVWGEAGIGKSHLLARLARWGENSACFVWLHNLQAAPAQLPRTLLRAVTTTLTRSQSHFYRTPLFDLVHAGVVAAVGGKLRFHSWDRLGRVFASWVERPDRNAPAGTPSVDRSVFEVLFAFYRSAYRTRVRREDGRTAALAVRWLSGQPLEPQEARALNLRPARNEPVVLADTHQIGQVLAAFARLAICRERPFVLALDQVDNLDDEQAAAFARFVESLLDAAPGMLTVTTGVQSVLSGWHERHLIPDSSWDRLAQFQVRLPRLSVGEAGQMLAARLDGFLKPFADLEPLRRRRDEDDLFPLGRPWWLGCTVDRTEVRPRDALSWARERWLEQQDRLRGLGAAAWLAVETHPDTVAPADTSPEQWCEATDRAVEDQLANERATHCHTPLPPDDPEPLAALLFHLLTQCRDVEPDLGLLEVERLAARRGVPPICDLALVQLSDRRPMRTGVMVLTASQIDGVPGLLRRAVSECQPLDRLIIVSEQSAGLHLVERRQEYFTQMGGQPANLAAFELTEAECAALETLNAVVQQARIGQIAIEQPSAKVLTAMEVIESHQRRGRYLDCRLLRELLAVPHPLPADNPSYGAGPMTKPEPIAP
jgi:hypothetical protein